MAGRREKLDIIKDILEAIRDKGGKIKPTHLLYKSNLSHDSMKRYVQELVEKDMVQEIEEKKENKKYVITDKGLKFLTDYRQIKEFTDSFGF
ncbi:MAG TPA: winged helix-turn-helix domain-containing protein [Candidatus Nanoarchaeia archaeon]|nr:winged helix-turn-helix domain-containing protein [Candidatus Nanoarchaeia archaeon]